ncbi:MAG: hypothetical protein CMO55_06465 [Verrucomicrobiales bacterium]|nr:hypothetical protein [Verrucomicrobiales bacterium]
MRSLVCFVLGLMLSAQADEMKGWKDTLSGVVFENPPLKTLPVVSSPKREGESLLVQVTNESDTVIHYQDYLGKRPSIYTEEKFEGKWIRSEWDSCGTGCEPQSIKPGKSVTLTIPISYEDKKIYVAFFDGWEKNSASSLVLVYAPGAG